MLDKKKERIFLNHNNTFVVNMLIHSTKHKIKSFERFKQFNLINQTHCRC